MQYHEIGKTGMKVSSLSFGASSLGGVFHDLKEKEGIQAVFTAVEAGMNFIDVSPSVNPNSPQRLGIQRNCSHRLRSNRRLFPTQET